MASRSFPFARACLELTKPGISFFIGLTSLCGFFVRPELVESWLFFPALFLSSYATSAGSAAFNQYYEQDLDRQMQRTRSRPLPSGRLSPPFALAFALFMLVSGLALAYFLCGVYTALFLLLGAFSYIVLYTIITKRRTAWNVPLGGFCGFFAAYAGVVGNGGEITQEGHAYALLLYFWSAPHFWSLAIFKRADYEKVGIPMLPVVVGSRKTALATLAHVLVLIPVSTLFWSMALPAALLILLAALLFAYYSVLLWHAALMLTEETLLRRARQNFLYSLAYLPLVFLGLGVGYAMRS